MAAQVSRVHDSVMLVLPPLRRALQMVVDRGGYAQAAESLHKSQSSVTYAAQKLESLFGRIDVFETVLGGAAEAPSIIAARTMWGPSTRPLFHVRALPYGPGHCRQVADLEDAVENVGREDIRVLDGSVQNGWIVGEQAERAIICHVHVAIWQCRHQPLTFAGQAHRATRDARRAGRHDRFDAPVPNRRWHRTWDARRGHGVCHETRLQACMTYCVGVLLNSGIVMASDSRTNAGVDNFATFCKMSVFERVDDRVIVLLSSGSLAGTQAVISRLRQRCEAGDRTPSLWTAQTLFDAVVLVTDAVREIESRDGKHLQGSGSPFNASFIIGGQIKGKPARLFRTFAEGNFIEAGLDTPFFQTGEAKYGKPIIDRVIEPGTSLTDAMKCVLVSFDSTMRSNLSVGMPIDLACYESDSLKLGLRRRFDQGDAYFSTLSNQWSCGVRAVFRELPDLPS